MALFGETTVPQQDDNKIILNDRMLLPQFIELPLKS